MHVLRAAEGLGHVATARAEVLLVEDVERGAVFLRQLRQANAGDRHRTVCAARGVARPDVRGKRIEISHSRATYIFSGVLTPTMVKALAMTWRVALASARRAKWMGSVSSSAFGRTWHWS